MAKKSAKRTLIIILVIVLIFMIITLIPAVSTMVGTGDIGSVFLVSGMTILIFLPWIGALIFGISTKSKEEKGIPVRKANKTANVLFKILVTLGVSLPILAVVILLAMSRENSPVTEGTSGVVIYGGIPMICGIPSGIPIWLVVAVVVGGVGIWLITFLYGKIDKMFNQNY